MTLDESEWDAATPADDVLTHVYEILAEDPKTAYCVDDFFRDVAPSAPEAFELTERLLEAIEHRASRERSEAVVETALETLAYENRVEKRTHVTDDRTVAYYRVTDEDA